MIECIFTLDYEIYGNGLGSLRDLVYEPTERLIGIFRKHHVSFVAFVEAAELEIIETNAADAAVNLVKEQIRQLYRDGFEIGLHLHPQWYNARRENGNWLLDYHEYNLCRLSEARIREIVRRSIEYLRGVLAQPRFVPLSFRAGNWLLQPSGTAAAVLAENGIGVDSSVFKGGVQNRWGLDYRPALVNGYYWYFEGDVNVEDRAGRLLEIPIYTKMVPLWRMISKKRMALQRKGNVSTPKQAGWPKRLQLDQLRDRFRFRYPLKFDFCRMTWDELRSTIKDVIREDRKSPDLLKPVVAIGHSKDLTDLETVDSLLSYLKDSGIRVSSFERVHGQCLDAGRTPGANFNGAAARHA